MVTGILPTATASGLPANPTLSNPVSVASGGPTNVFDEILKATPAALIAFLANLPAVDGNLSNYIICFKIIKFLSGLFFYCFFCTRNIFIGSIKLQKRRPHVIDYKDYKWSFQLKRREKKL